MQVILLLYSAIICIIKYKFVLFNCCLCLCSDSDGDSEGGHPNEGGWGQIWDWFGDEPPQVIPEH